MLYIMCSKYIHLKIKINNKNKYRKNSNEFLVSPKSILKNYQIKKEQRKNRAGHYTYIWIYFGIQYLYEI